MEARDAMLLEEASRATIQHIDKPKSVVYK